MTKVNIYRAQFHTSMWDSPRAEGTATKVSPGDVVIAVGEVVVYDHVVQEDSNMFSTKRACQAYLTSAGIKYLVWGPNWRDGEMNADYFVCKL